MKDSYSLLTAVNDDINAFIEEGMKDSYSLLTAVHNDINASF